MIAWDARQRALRERFAGLHERLNAVTREHGGIDDFSWAKWELLRHSGIIGLAFEEEFGGAGEDLLTTMYVLEDLGYGCRDGGLNFSLCTHVASAGLPLQRFGSEELRKRYMPRLCDGSAIGAHAITEPQAGSDVLGMHTQAVDRGDHYVLTGVKAHVTNGPVADVFVIYARTKSEAGPFGITAFVVDREAPGLQSGNAVPKLGLDGSPVGELVLDQCEVGTANVLGIPGSGFLVLEHVLKWEILCTFVVSVGSMQHRLERCIAHARGRHQFGRPIGSFQSVANKIVDMKISVETARRWLYDSALRLAQNQDASIDVAITKLLTSEANIASALAAVQIFGANGYTTACGLEADLRDAIAGTIYSGTSEIQRERIARMLGLGEHAGERRASLVNSSTSVRR
jgi:alkylation response protein AidB-like acyl-CoA dehydrogenase